MIEVNVLCLSGGALDYAVASLMSSDSGLSWERKLVYLDSGWTLKQFSPSRFWEDDGRLIQTLEISLVAVGDGSWYAYRNILQYPTNVFGKTPLEAAMRCLVYCKVGNNINIPKDLSGENE